MYRTPKDEITCKFEHTYWETIGEKWMGQVEQFECLSTKELTPEQEKVYDDITKCSPACPAYEPIETTICKKHNVEYYEECPMCMAEQDAAQDAKRDNAGSNR